MAIAVLVVVLLVGLGLLFLVPKGRRSRSGTVEDRAPGRD